MKKITLFINLFLFCSLLAFGAEKVKPKDGQGIYKLLQSNGRDPNADFDAFVELNKNKLGKNQSLIKGVSYTLPPLASNTTARAKTTTTSAPRAAKKNTYVESLFGKNYDEYTVESSKLAGATFYLVSGHGGPDCGAIGKVNGVSIHEKEYAYDIMLRLARKLKMEGATVHIIIQDKKDGIRDEKFLKNTSRETCRGKVIPLSQVKRLQQRCDEINSLSAQSKNKYQRAVFIHLDSRSNDKKLDVFFYFNQSSSAGKQLANTMRTTFKEQYHIHQPTRGFSGTVSTRKLYVLENTKTPSLFAELGNIQNSDDQKRFLLSGNRQALADWMCLGLIADYEKSRK